MIRKERVIELVRDGLTQHHGGIAGSAVEAILSRFGEIEHCVALDTDVERAGLIRAMLENDKTRNPADYRVVPLPSELLAVEVARLETSGVVVDPERKLSLHRQLSRLTEEERLAKGEEWGIETKAETLRTSAPTSEDAPLARKRVVDMSELEVEELLTSKYGPAPPTGRLASEYRRLRQALIDAEQNEPNPRDVREVAVAKALEQQRNLSPMERIRAFRADRAIKQTA